MCVCKDVWVCLWWLLHVVGVVVMHHCLIMGGWSELFLQQSILADTLLAAVSLLPVGGSSGRGSSSSSSSHLGVLLRHLHFLLLTAGGHVGEHTQHGVADLVRLRETRKVVLCRWEVFEMLHSRSHQGFNYFPSIKLYITPVLSTNSLSNTDM